MKMKICVERGFRKPLQTITSADKLSKLPLSDKGDAEADKLSRLPLSDKGDVEADKLSRSPQSDKGKLNP